MVHTAQARRPQRRGSGRRGRQRAMSALWGAVQAADTDPITALAAALKDDPHPDKVGLCQGKYMDEQGQPYLLRAVEQAEAEMALEVSYPQLIRTPHLILTSSPPNLVTAVRSRVPAGGGRPRVHSSGA